jgi:2-oxoglutarate ferredoxin oxidoreductase subunit gamma
MEAQVLFAGFGGQGVLSMAKFLAVAAMREGKNVSWVPSYGAEMRGGTANCLVTISSEEIASPVTEFPSLGVILNDPSMEKFAPKILSGGALVVNTSLVRRSSGRRDLRTLELPVNELAGRLGSALSANMLLMGACLAYSGLVGIDQATRAIEATFASKGDDVIALNREAFLAGVRYVKSRAAAAV